MNLRFKREAILLQGAEPVIVVSMYARWIIPHFLTKTLGKVNCPEGSTHGIILDLWAFIGSTDPSTHRLLAVGDLNMIYGATDK